MERKLQWRDWVGQFYPHLAGLKITAVETIAERCLCDVFVSVATRDPAIYLDEHLKRNHTGRFVTICVKPLSITTTFQRSRWRSAVLFVTICDNALVVADNQEREECREWADPECDPVGMINRVLDGMVVAKGQLRQI